MRFVVVNKASDVKADQVRLTSFIRVSHHYHNRRQDLFCFSSGSIAGVTFALVVVLEIGLKLFINSIA